MSSSSLISKKDSWLHTENTTDEELSRINFIHNDEYTDPILYVDETNLDEIESIPLITREIVELLLQNPRTNEILRNDYFIPNLEIFLEFWDIICSKYPVLTSRFDNNQHYLIWLKNSLIKILISLTQYEFTVSSLNVSDFTDQDDGSHYIAYFINLESDITDINQLVEYELEVFPHLIDQLSESPFKNLESTFFINVLE